ncbi:PhoH family protein [Coriobacteriaceae bacterium]|uniref:PhoH-like protein n=1 Tax=Granulimonas faecalis TaxID=2894155 RepID=A0AAV5B154_9ACTN|nr:PhoH family protein [Granulimonas faecalis]TGY60792.1 PhoH family protein [Coriobacteriaceae bacterium]GJM55266.1 phosphate starvation protein PhoH [Granulimonas faecalis]
MEPTQVRLTVPDSLDITRVMGPADSLLRRIEAATDAAVSVRGNTVAVIGSAEEANALVQVFSALIREVEAGGTPTEADVDLLLSQAAAGNAPQAAPFDDILVTHRGRPIRPKTVGQASYIDAIRTHTVTFALGPAGTGKTYLAMAMAVAALKRRDVGRVVLTRPVVEAGESLGFLPGTLEEKLDPYVRPLYDALFDMVDAEKAATMVDQGVIEIAPLAFMRGRTLNDAFVILDEAQNTTPEQMKMFLTRLGFRSTFVVTGDTTQRDIAGTGGLDSARRVLEGVEDIAFCDLDRADIVRHTLVGRIVDAYAAAEGR